eukprot:scaffold7.g3694.t1
MAAAGMLSVQLGSTPPLATPARAAAGPRRGTAVVVGFRTSDSEQPSAGSVKSSWSRSVPPPDLSSFVLSKSAGGRRVASEGLGGPRGALPSQASIPKSASFVKVEGFAMPADAAPSPGATPPTSPQPKPLGSSLLSRQLTHERLPVVGLDEPSLLVQQLERAVSGGSPAAPGLPGGRRRPSVPEDLLQRLAADERYAVFREPLVARAFSLSRSAHDGQYRASGDPAFLHCVEVARELAGMGANERVVAAALLHDVLDDTPLVEGQLRAMVRSDAVVDLVKQVSHLADLSSKYRAHPATSPGAQAATASALVTMMVAMSADPAPLLIKLADRVHDMRTAAALPPAKRNRLAAETQDVWAPLANRLGVWKLKATLEDLAFRQLQPEEYGALATALDGAQAASSLQHVVDDIRDALARHRGGPIVPAELTARRKNVWGVWSKMAKKGYSLDRIADVRGVRVIVETKEQCYEALRAIYDNFEADMSREKNYIRSPKPNNYQSLHAVVRARDGHWVEVQIRTKVMHYLAEYGKDAAHWTYKEGRKGGRQPASDDGREASWAKFNASQQVSDEKCRPSGSPPAGAAWLESILSRDGEAALSSSSGSATSSAPAAPGEAPAGGAAGARSGSSPKRDFIDYLEWSSQTLAPHSAGRELVCLVAGGGLDVRSVAKGTTLGGLLAATAASAAEPHVLVNKQLEAGRTYVLRTGDVVEVYVPGEEGAPAPAPSGDVDLPSRLAAAPLSPRAAPAPAAAAPPASPHAPLPPRAPKVVVLPPSAGNIVPLGGLSAKLRRAAAPSS